MNPLDALLDLRQHPFVWNCGAFDFRQYELLRLTRVGWNSDEP